MMAAKFFAYLAFFATPLPLCPKIHKNICNPLPPPKCGRHMWMVPKHIANITVVVVSHLRLFPSCSALQEYIILPSSSSPPSSSSLPPHPQSHIHHAVQPSASGTIYEEDGSSCSISIGTIFSFGIFNILFGGGLFSPSVPLTNRISL